MRLSELPSVDEVVQCLADLESRYPRRVIVDEVRRVVEHTRGEIREGLPRDPTDIQARVRASLAALEAPSLRRVINATGVVLHTNLGRAPLAPFEPISGYSNLEYDLAAGRRGKRDIHIGSLLERLAGYPGIAVNNNAAAIYLAMNELAAGAEVIVSRGELIEIGDGFRIPDIMRASGAILREVGTTNRTAIGDYREAITDRTRLLLRVHPSNFRIEGFTARPAMRELSALARERNLPLYEDLGSGCVVDLKPLGIDEPLAGDSLRDGADLVSFSGDKLLGGPQAGILCGKPDLVARLRRNPMFRALRLDKVIYQSLETTLRHLVLERYDRIPALRMLRANPEVIQLRAASLMARLRTSEPEAEWLVEVRPGHSVAGGGSTPLQTLDTWLIAIQVPDVVVFESRLRRHAPPVIARIEENTLLLDLRTVFEKEEEELISALGYARSR